MHSLEFEIKMTKSFLDMFKAPVYEKIFGAHVHGSTNLTTLGEWTEDDLKSEKPLKMFFFVSHFRWKIEKAGATKKTLDLSFAIQAN